MDHKVGSGDRIVIRVGDRTLCFLIGCVHCSTETNKMDLPDGWVRGTDAAYNNRPYYYNKRTRRSTWTKPCIEPSVAYVKSPIAKQNDSPFKQDWVKVYSAEHQRHYYFNKKTKESRWHKPDQLVQGEKVHDEQSPESPALRQAWADIEASRKLLLKEREEHVKKMRDEFDKLQEQLQHLRLMSNETSFSPVNSPIEYPVINTVKHEPHSHAAENRSRLEAKRAATLSEEPVNIPSTRTKIVPATNAYTSGLLSELEDFAEHLLQRRDSISKMSPSNAEQELLAQESSRRVLVETARTRKASIGETFDEEAYINEVMGGLNFGSDSYKQTGRMTGHMSEELVAALTPEEIAEETQAINSALKAVQDEAEAVRKAYEEIQNLDDNCYYKALGVPPDATSGQIKKAYYKLMKVYHPDKVQDVDDLEIQKKTQTIQKAYQCLMDDWERTLYDEMGLEQYLVHEKVVQCFINYMVTGISVRKHPRKTHGAGPLKSIFKGMSIKKKHFWLDVDHLHFCTAKKHNLEPTKEDLENKVIKRVEIANISKIVKGMGTEVLQHTGKSSRKNRYFSIICDERSLDLETESSQRDFLHSRLTLLTIHLQKNHSWLKDWYRERNRASKNARKRRSA